MVICMWYILFLYEVPISGKDIALQSCPELVDQICPCTYFSLMKIAVLTLTLFTNR